MKRRSNERTNKRTGKAVGHLAITLTLIIFPSVVPANAQQVIRPPIRQLINDRHVTSQGYSLFPSSVEPDSPRYFSGTRPFGEAHSMLTIFGGVIFLWLAVGILSVLGRQSGDKLLLECFSGTATSRDKSPVNSPSDSSSASGQAKICQSRQFLQYALDQAAQAESYAAATAVGDKSAKLSAAAAAQNCANAAAGWAAHATTTAGGGPSQATDAAISARNAANRAQSAADRAKYNAATSR